MHHNQILLIWKYPFRALRNRAGIGYTDSGKQLENFCFTCSRRLITSWFGIHCHRVTGSCRLEDHLHHLVQPRFAKPLSFMLFKELQLTQRWDNSHLTTRQLLKQMSWWPLLSHELKIYGLWLVTAKIAFAGLQGIALNILKLQRHRRKNCSNIYSIQLEDFKKYLSLFLF